MKRIRGFGYVGNDEPSEDDLEPDEIELEHGFASEHVIPGSREVKAYTCPRCKQILFEADVTLHGVIFLRCRRCRREVAIETAPRVRPIGFIDRLHKEEDSNAG